ncbi:hypothetical protein V8G54_015737 [Vigna mungo]|uniref:Pentatricopeptide repeat-containing protein n=1 Tax=Vigna mungo TaxID=3915 RepID=A0AAQ3RYP4_VIGMU
MAWSCVSVSSSILHFLPAASDPPYSILQNHPHLTLLSNCPNIATLKQIHSLIIKTGLHNTLFAQSKLIEFCALSPSQDLSYALSLFHSIQHPNIFICNTLIRAHSLTPSPTSSLDLYNHMLHSGLHPNSHTFPFLFKSCAKARATHLGKQLHAHVFKLALHCHPHVHTSLIHMYSQLGELQHARDPFGIHAMEGGLKEFFLAVAKTVLSATIKYATPSVVLLAALRMSHLPVEIMRA